MKLERPPRGLSGLFSWLERLWDYLLSQEDIRSPSIAISRTTKGISRRSLAEEGGGESGTLQFKGQWVDGEYAKDDIVIRGGEATSDERSIMDDGGKAGTYTATEAVHEFDLPPGESGGSGAVLSAAVSAGAVTGITVVTPGSGYGNFSIVTIGGPGTGATAHFAFGGSGEITSVTVDAGGTGYTSATATMDNNPQKWVDFALGKWRKLTFRRGQQRIVIDTGRDGSPDAPTMTVYKDYSDASAGSIRLSIQDLLDILGSEAGADIEVKPRITLACDDSDFSIKHTVVLRGDYYTPP